MKNLLFFSLLLLSGMGKAQTLSHQLIANGGGSMVNSRADQISWSIGELMVATFSRADFVLTQGFQQSENLTITSIFEDPLAEKEILIFPNPAIDRFFVEIKNYDQPIEAMLYNLLGQPLQKLQVSGQTEVDLQLYPSGVYVLSMIAEDGSRYSFKIQKQ